MSTTQAGSRCHIRLDKLFLKTLDLPQALNNMG